jgi:hypothetical protein
VYPSCQLRSPLHSQSDSGSLQNSVQGTEVTVMKIKGQRLWRSACFALPALFLLCWYLRGNSWSHGWEMIKQVGPRAGWILVPLTLQLVLDAMAWRWLYRRLGKSVPLVPLLGVRWAMEAVLLSVSAGALVADGVTPWAMKHHQNVAMEDTTVTVIVRKFMLLISQAFYVGTGALFGVLWAMVHRSSHVSGTITWLPWISLVCATAIFGLVLVLGRLLSRGTWGSWLFGKAMGVPWYRWQQWVRGYQASLECTEQAFKRLWNGSWKGLSLPLSLFFAGWMMESLETYTIMHLLHVDLSFVQVWSTEPSIACIKHLLFFIPSGMGIQDVGYLMLFREAGYAHAGSLGIAFVLLRRSKDLFFVLSGCVWWIVLRLWFRTPIQKLGPQPLQILANSSAVYNKGIV